MPKDAATPHAGTAPEAPPMLADDLIASCGGDPRAAVIALSHAVQRLERENRALRRAASPGFIRRTLPPLPPLDPDESE